MARVRARLRSAGERPPETLRIGDLTIDVAGHSVRRDGRSLPLTPLEFELLVTLARKPWQAFTRELLLEQVWATATRRTPGSSTSTSSGCARRSNAIPSTPRSS